MTFQELNKLLASPETPTVGEPLASLIQAGFNHFAATAFEAFILRVFEALDLHGSLTPPTGDEGADIILQDPSGVIIVQCKKYDTDTKVGSKELREFLGAMLHAKAIHGYYVSTSSFTDQAKSFCADHHEITLIDADQLKRLVLISIVVSFQKLGRMHIPPLKDEQAELGPEFQIQAEGLYKEYLRELEKIKETARRSKPRR